MEFAPTARTSDMLRTKIDLDAIMKKNSLLSFPVHIYSKFDSILLDGLVKEIIVYEVQIDTVIYSYYFSHSSFFISI